MRQEPRGSERVKKSTSPVIPSAALDRPVQGAARRLHVFVFKDINADASLRSARQSDFFTRSQGRVVLAENFGRKADADGQLSELFTAEPQ